MCQKQNSEFEAWHSFPVWFGDKFTRDSKATWLLSTLSGKKDDWCQNSMLSENVKGEKTFLWRFFLTNKHLRSVRAPLNPVFYCGPAVTRRVNNAPKNKNAYLQETFLVLRTSQSELPVFECLQGLLAKMCIYFSYTMQRPNACMEILIETWQMWRISLYLSGRKGTPNRSCCTTRMARSFFREITLRY